jgi:GT2 family glycosyltransferase
VIVDDGDIEITNEIVDKVSQINCKVIQGDSKGLPASRNKGIKYTTGEIVCFVDDDVILPISWLEEILHTYEKDDPAGVGGLVINQTSDGVKKGNMGDFYYRLLTAVRTVIFYHRVGEFGLCGVLYSPHTIAGIGTKAADALQGCNMTFRKDILSKFQFDEWYGEGGSAPCEELDFCAQLRANGHQLMFNPRAIVLHNRSSEGGGRSKFKDNNYRGIRNRSYFVRKNIGVRSIDLFCLLLVSIVLTIVSRSVTPLRQFTAGACGAP